MYVMHLYGVCLYVCVCVCVCMIQFLKCEYTYACVYDSNKDI